MEKRLLYCFFDFFEKIWLIYHHQFIIFLKSAAGVSSCVAGGHPAIQMAGHSTRARAAYQIYKIKVGGVVVEAPPSILTQRQHLVFILFWFPPWPLPFSLLLPLSLFFPSSFLLLSLYLSACYLISSLPSAILNPFLRFSCLYLSSSFVIIFFLLPYIFYLSFFLNTFLLFFYTFSLCLLLFYLY